MKKTVKNTMDHKLTGTTTALSSKIIPPLSVEWFFDYYWSDPELYYKLYARTGAGVYKGLDECNKILLAMSSE